MDSQWRRYCMVVLALLTVFRTLGAQQTGVAGQAGNQPALQEEVRQLREAVVQLQAQVANLTSELRKAVLLASPPAQAPPSAPAPPNAAQETNLQPLPNAEVGTLARSMRETTFNFHLDGYYAYNFNRPAGRVNLLRAYDVTDRAFNLNQAGLVVERAPDLVDGRRWGMRLDLMYGQATETLQGSPQNEARPWVFRPVFQAFGSYIAPLGTGLRLDFGKWASSLGYEGNYTKDQINYSRSFLFAFLPAYHMGIRASYDVNERLKVAYWLANGTNQTEDFNSFKSQMFALTAKPVRNVTWTMNYHFGREQRALAPGHSGPADATGALGNTLTVAPRGRLHILDTYAAWDVTPKLLLAGEADYVINRTDPGLSPARVTGGAGYARYQFVPRFSLASRFEYLSDRGGLFSGRTAALKESTVTATYEAATGFQTRIEYRRDLSNQPLFLSREPGSFRKKQETLTLGLVWWLGGKEGAW